VQADITVQCAVLRIYEMSDLGGTVNAVTIMKYKRLRRPWHIPWSRTHGMHSKLEAGTASEKATGWMGVEST
jgi:hypothetical protein